MANESNPNGLDDEQLQGVRDAAAYLKTLNFKSYRFDDGAWIGGGVSLTERNTETGQDG